MKYLNSIEVIIEKLKSRAENKEAIRSSELIEFLKDDLKPLTSGLSLTEMEAIFFCQIFYLTLNGHRVTHEGINVKLKVSPFDYLLVKGAVDSLVKKGYCSKSSDDYGDLNYYVSSDIQEDLINETIEILVPKVSVDIYDLADACMKVFKERENRRIRLKEMYNELSKILDINKDFSVVKQLNTYSLKKEDTMILLFLICKRAEFQEVIELSEIASTVFDKIRDRARFQHKFIRQEGELYKQNLIMNVDGEYSDASCIKLCDFIYKDFFGDEFNGGKKKRGASKSCKFIKAEGIASQQLYYNPSTQAAVDTLRELFTEDKYQEVKSRLASNNMRLGVTMVFYGGPGTGKTETIYQLCRESGRDIMMIDISAIKNKYVGESEKNLKAVFKEYNYTIKNQVKCPILFLNEADALISKRVDINTSVDQMSNTMQNILLQELEDFEGILCATTNLLDNIDAAFERRFLYKTKFEKPGVIERSKIWQSRFGILNENDAIDLANQFELSGAEIENISRKMQIESVLFNKAIDLENIVSHCKEERYNDSLNKNQIGFMKNQ
jgi:hypothetical protein